jgi:DNA-binding winged helix-turn-helix (wHTH) protein/Tol biopolymer transport system component
VTLRDFSQTGSAYSFLDVTLDVSAERVTRGATELKLRPKSFQVLRYLAERAGRVVTREELLQAIWPDVVVTDESLTKCITDIRKALSDDAQKVIRTVARRGYVFAAPITRTLDFPRQADQQNEHGVASVTPIIRRTEHSFAEVVSSKIPTAVRLRFWAGLLAVLLVAAGITVVVFQAALFRAARPERGNVAAALHYTQLTNFTDAAFSPALSPDGRMLTFIRGENPGTVGGPGDVYIKLLPDGEPVRLTHDGKGKVNPVFTPGGDRVSYAYTSLMTDSQNWSTWTVSVFGGEPKPLLANASALTWIPGSPRSRVLFSRVDAGVHMSIVSSRENGTESRTVYAPPTPSAMAHRSFLSPDGKHVLVVEMKAGGWGPCLLVPFESDIRKESSARVGRPVGPSPGQCSGSAWSPDGKWMYFSVNTGTGYHIWRQRFPDGAPQQVTFGATEEREITFDPDGGSFLTSAGTRQSTLWIHDGSGERQITSEGYASSPRFSPDGNRLYYLLRSGANRRYVSGELWSANLETGKRERLLPEFLLADYSVSRDGNRILFVTIADDGATSVWMALLDGRTVPYRLSNVTAERAFFGADGEVFFLGADETNRRFLYRIHEDGSDLQKAILDPIVDVYDVSPNGQSVAAWLGSAVQVLSIHGRPAMTASAVCASNGGENSGTTPPCVSWSPNGRFLYLNDRVAGQIYALPIPHGRSIPALPDAGIASAKQAAAWPGVRVIREGSAFVGADPSVYAFFRVTTQRNIYRIGVPVEQE